MSDQFVLSARIRTHPLRVLALMEASAVTGPAKNLIEFASRAAQGTNGTSAVELAVITYQRDASTPCAFVTAVRKAGIQAFVLDERRPFDFKPMKALREVVIAFRPDIVQSHNVKSHLFVRLLGLYRDYPWLAFNHGYTTRDLRDRFYNQFDRWSLRAAYRVITVCGAFAKQLERMGVAPERLRVQHNSVRPFVTPEPDVIEQIRGQLRLGSEQVVLAVGRLSREKGHADLLRAMALLRQKGTACNFRMLIVGDGPERQNLVRLSGQLGISDAVVFAGHQLDVRPFYALATLLALPSHSEGSPNVVLEAMAAGIPIVATAVGGIVEILEDGQTGLVVAAHDPPAMAGGVRCILEDENLRTRLASAAREHATTVYTPEAQCRGLIGIYEEALRSFRH